MRLLFVVSYELVIEFLLLAPDFVPKALQASFCTHLSRSLNLLFSSFGRNKAISKTVEICQGIIEVATLTEKLSPENGCFVT